MATPQEKKDQIKQRPAVTGGIAPVQQPPSLYAGKQPMGAYLSDAVTGNVTPGQPNQLRGAVDAVKSVIPPISMPSLPTPNPNGLYGSKQPMGAYVKDAFNGTGGGQLGDVVGAVKAVPGAIAAAAPSLPAPNPNSFYGSKQPMADYVAGALDGTGTGQLADLVGGVKAIPGVAADAALNLGQNQSAGISQAALTADPIAPLADMSGRIAAASGAFDQRVNDLKANTGQALMNVPGAIADVLSPVGDAVSGVNLTNPLMSTVGGFEKYAGQIADSAAMPNAGLAERSGAVVADAAQGVLATGANLATDAVRPLAMAVDPIMDFGRGLFGIKSANAAGGQIQPPPASGTFDSTNMTDAQREVAVAQGEDLDQLVIPQPLATTAAAAAPLNTGVVTNVPGENPSFSAQAPGNTSGSYGIDPPPVGGNVRQGIEVIRGTERSVADPYTGLERKAGVDDLNYLQFGDGAPSRTGDDVAFNTAREGAQLDNRKKEADIAETYASAGERNANAGALGRSNRAAGTGVSPSGRVGGGQYDVATKPVVSRTKEGVVMSYMDSADQSRQILLPEGTDPNSVKVDYVSGKVDKKTGAISQSRTYITNKYTGDLIFDSAAGQEGGAVAAPDGSAMLTLQDYTEAAQQLYPDLPPEQQAEWANNVYRKQQPAQALEDEE